MEKFNIVWYICFVCRDEVGCSDLNGFNYYIDICLSKFVVKECLRYILEDESLKSKKIFFRKIVILKWKSFISILKFINLRFKIL